MLLELLSLLFHIYYWMTWLKGSGMLPEMDELESMLNQDNADA